MATLDLEESDIDSEYSDGFLEDLSYSQSSSEEESTHELVARLESSLAKDRPGSNKDTSNSKQAWRGNKTSDLGKTLRMPVKIAKSSSVEKFNSSVDVRDACYSSWLSQKRTSISLDQSSKQRAVNEEQMKKKLKETEKVERAKKTVERWNKSKTEELQKKSKTKQEMAKLKELEEEEKRQKMIATQAVSEKWREEKTRDLVKKQRKLRKKREEEAKKNIEKMTEKTDDAVHAFNAWKQKKDGHLKEHRKKQHKEKQILEGKSRQQKTERLDDSKKAFEAWRSKKDDVLQTTKTQYTYKKRPKIHTRAWCPARGMKHAYPKDPAAVKKKTSRASSTLSESPSVKSYESESFESASTSENSFIDSESEQSVDVAPMCSITGKRKTIQVCCQTLEYWCTCQH